MNVCLDCFMKMPETTDLDFYNRRDTRYVKLTKVDLTCDICGEKKPVIGNAIHYQANPYRNKPVPEGWINVLELSKKMAERAENTPLNEEE